MGNAASGRSRSRSGNSSESNTTTAARQYEEVLAEPPERDPVCSSFTRCCSCFLPPDRLRKLLVTAQLRRLHRALTTPFAPDGWNTVEHGWLLRSIWRNLRPGESYVRKGAGWKACGFQGNDPATDVRGGGLLAVQCLEHFSDAHAAGMRAMLEENDAVAAADPLRFYPVSTTAIVVVSKLCDALGLSEGMRGPISAEELDGLLASPHSPTRRGGSILKMLVPDAGSRITRRSRGGFNGLFALLLADFHARFVRKKTTYMQVQGLLTETFADLERQVRRPCLASSRTPRATAVVVAAIDAAEAGTTRCFDVPRCFEVRARPPTARRLPTRDRPPAPTTPTPHHHPRGR